jgi:predicted acylesterase/phospholipase RssA
MKHLAIGPGVLGYFAYLGVLKKLSDDKQLDFLEEISGSSAGGIVAFLYVVARGNFERMLKISLNIPIHKMVKPDLKTFLKNYGLIPYERIRDVFSSALSKLIPKKTDITFKELYYHFPVKLHIPAFCVNTAQTVYFSVDTHPDMSVIDAVYMTIAIPFIFESFEYKDWRYIDGAFMETTPCAPFLNKQDVLAIRLVHKSEQTFSDFKSYVHLILSAIMKNRYKYETVKHLFIDMGETSVYNFNMTTEEKMKMYTLGYELTTAS